MKRRTVVVKVGSSTLVDERGRARARVFSQVAADVVALLAESTPVVIVSSGAIALGLGTLGRDQRPRRLAELQAASAVGQSLLLRRWERALARRGGRGAQVLLTVGDIHRRDGYLNARRTLETLLAWGLVPIVNENDSTPTDEISVGDTDALAAPVAVRLRGRLHVHGGARAALAERGTSLLAVGVVSVDGSFAAGDAVEICEGGRAFAIGLAGHSAAEQRRLAGSRGVDEAVHRDNLVVL